MSKVGIVLLNYDTPDMTCRLAKQFNEYNCINSIVVVDNKSTDDSIIKIDKFLGEVSSKKLFFIKNECNLGYAKGNNIGLRWLVEQESCDLCFIANPDIEIDEQSLQIVISAFENNSLFGILSCMREYEDGNYIRQSWQLPQYTDLLLECFSLYRKKNKNKDAVEIDKDKDIDIVECVPGAFFGIRSDVLKKFDYLDEGTFLYFEENCLGKKAKLYSVVEGIVTSAKYVTYADKSSTVEIRRNGIGFKHLQDSKLFYAQKYICKNKSSFYLYKVLMMYSNLEYSIIKKLKKG